MGLLYVKIDTVSGKKLSKSLFENDISHLHRGFDINGTVSDLSSEELDLYKSQEYIEVEYNSDILMSITMYSQFNKQVWFIQTNFAKQLVCKLVRDYNLICKNCEFDKLLE
jgi:hypothetical protein